MGLKKGWKNRKAILKLLRKSWFELLVRILILPIVFILWGFEILGDLASKALLGLTDFLDDRFNN